jgi:hypothetical protein
MPYKAFFKLTEGDFMNYEPKNTGRRPITRIIITVPDKEDHVCLDIADESNDKYKDAFIVSDSDENVCQLTISLSHIDVLIDNLKRASETARRLVNT